MGYYVSLKILILKRRLILKKNILSFVNFSERTTATSK